MNFYKIIGNDRYKYGHNKVYADDENFYIRSPKRDVYLIINKDKSVLDFIEKCIAKYGALHSTNNSHGFEMCKEHNGQRSRVYISKCLIEYYTGKKLKGKYKLRYIDGNPLNCKPENIIVIRGKELIMESSSVSITFDKDYIYIKEKKTGLVFVTNYEPELLYLIASPRISWNLQNSRDYAGGKDYNRLIAELFYNGKKSKHIYPSLSRLVFGYYYYGVRRNNMITALRSMDKDLAQKGLIIEHLIADELNNTKANLSAMSTITNSKKKVIDRKIIPPYYLVMAYRDGIYKAVYCIKSGLTFVNPVMTFTTPESLLNGLKSIASSDVLCRYKNALEWRTLSNMPKYNLLKSYILQKIMYDNFENPNLDILLASYIDIFYDYEGEANWEE